MTHFAKNTSSASPEGEKKIHLRMAFIGNRKSVSMQIARIVAGVLDPKGQLPLHVDTEKLEIPLSKVGEVRQAISSVLFRNELEIHERDDEIVILDEEKPSVWEETIGPGNFRPRQTVQPKRTSRLRHQNRNRKNGSVPF